ncbi:MAG TPA: L,D-transpeptidase [Polyangia bacterium]|nr:L,D-transpeptidase [Polyangia bacterium]
MALIAGLTGGGVARAADDGDALPPTPAVAAEQRAIQVVGGSERVVDVAVARARGLTVVDLSDGWVPRVLADQPGPQGTVLENPYRAIYSGLASDRGDGDGQPLAGGESNYLDLYGIPPTLSVMRRRFLEDSRRTCAADIDADTLLAVDEVPTWGASTEQKELGKRRARGVRLEAARVAAGVPTLEALAEKDPRTARDVKDQLAFAAQRAAFAEAERRLVCEGLMDAAKHKAGSYDTAMRTAMLQFQQKHAVIDQADIKRPTLEALARPPLENDMRALGRVLSERAMHAAGFLEDGSVNDAAAAGAGASSVVGATYLGADGTRHPVPDLATASREAVLARLGIATAADAVAFFRRHSRADFAWLKVAVRLPAPPEYYGPQMDLYAEIDRGDVWYDFPFNAAGVRLPQPRTRFPTFTMYVKWRGERVPLVRWRTTVGGWRVELASDGQEYYRYKGSDVGPRVWHHIVAAPVWIPPATSPLASMVKEKRVNGTYVKVTNYDETGPGYLSAYGLAAAIHEEMRRGPDGPTFFDNGIRTHGSFDYTSLRGRFSHGCHRLDNQLAVRLFSFVLGHRKMRVVGTIPLGSRRTFFAQGEVFEMRLPNRGFYYELDPPLPVDVLEGTVKGQLQKPIAGYVPKPGVKYASSRPPAASSSPDSRAGGGEAP